MAELTHRFLHGQRTNKPGSWCQGRPTCGNSKCAKLACEESPDAQANVEQSRKRKGGRSDKYVGDIIADLECEECKRERKAKTLVAHGPNDVRYRAEAFQRGIAIFPNNDVKYDNNKIRAHTYASDTDKQITYVKGSR